jgi:opacity protein-like surface antigen
MHSNKEKNVKKTMKAALAATLMLSAASAARADQTINGAFGLPLNPTAQIPEPNGVRIQANYYDFGSVENGDGDLAFYGLYAAGRLTDIPLEISGGVEKFHARGSDVDFLDDTSFSVGAKLLLTRDTDPQAVRVAAGVGYSDTFFKNIHGYVVATKYFGDLTGGKAPIAAHLGVRYDRYKVESITSNKPSIYGGVEIPITRDGKVSFVGEIQSKNAESEFDPEIPYSAAVRYRPTNGGFSASAGVQRQGVFGNITDRSSNFFVQIGYTFGR